MPADPDDFLSVQNRPVGVNQALLVEFLHEMVIWQDEFFRNRKKIENLF